MKTYRVEIFEYKTGKVVAVIGKGLSERSEALAQAYQERGEIEADRLANEANE